MGTVFKILLFAFILYFLYSWFTKLIAPSKGKQNNDRDVRIYKKGDIESSKLDVQDAETVEFEEIQNAEEVKKSDESHV